MLPLFHDFADETVLVFGGGSVGLRKARFFAREARTVVVGGRFEAGYDEVGEASLVRAHLDPEDVRGWFDRASPALAVAATDDGALNDAVEVEARERGVLVNRADRSGDREAGSVVVPATARDGGVVAAVATGGRSPALSKRLRERIEPLLDGADAMADLTADVREELRERETSPEARRRAVRAVVESNAVRNAISAGDDGREEAEAAVKDALDRSLTRD
ncbi:precorrin-2 dehydrogenase/sirohydrochlorin ferrochelatase family protein [Haladaptatus salinisoli]|uniref:precorrin-2 dehydrogenase/sirohydrochlorin ferrochelatase family protein n=1 Tax=Haladaptatus salinisoli TaxID=2884876 RepID=UPI001D0A7585|nr:bifunctional precorrin-2 dehydrogenase/sirohydrochlorin ferrochelatase [Haladaptatus salinisoli]